MGEKVAKKKKDGAKKRIGSRPTFWASLTGTKKKRAQDLHLRGEHITAVRMMDF